MKIEGRNVPTISQMYFQSFAPMPLSMDAAKAVRPTIVIDSREQTPLNFTRLASVVAGLDTGDYSIRGLETLFGIERKSIPDLVASVTSGRERFERELCRLRGHRFRRLLIVGNREEILRGNFRSNVSPKAVLHTLAAFEVRYDLPVVFEPTPEDAAARIESWAFWFAREIAKNADALATAPGEDLPEPCATA